MKLKAIWEQNSPYSKLLLTVGVILVSTTLFTVIGTAIATAMYGISAEQLPNYLANISTDPVAVSIMKIIQIASSIGVFIFPALFLAFVFSQDAGGFLKLNRSSTLPVVVLTAAMMLSAIPLINAMGEWNSHMHLPGFLSEVEKWMRDAEDRAAEITEAFMKMETGGDLLINFIMIALLPAIGEELLFRGVIQRVLSDWSRNRHIGIWIAALLFSAMHAQFYGFLPRMLLGALFGYLLVWSGSIWVPILAHLVNNGAAVLFTWFMSKGSVTWNIDTVGAHPEDAMWVIGSLLLTVAFTGLIYRRRLIG